jgi:hypothetical protein
MDIGSPHRTTGIMMKHDGKLNIQLKLSFGNLLVKVMTTSAVNLHDFYAKHHPKVCVVD